MRVKSGAQNTAGTHHHRGISTDVSSLPKSIPKSNSEVESGDEPYVHVRLTKDVLHAFEELTRTGTTALIRAYLDRCEQEPGEIEGLLTSGSSGDTSRNSSDDSDDDSDAESSGDSK